MEASVVDDDRSPLLDNGRTPQNISVQHDYDITDEVVTGNDVSGESCDHTAQISKRAFLLLNVVVILTSISYELKSPLLDQYLYHYYAGPLMEGNESANTASNPCFGGNVTKNGTTLEEQVQEKTSSIMFYLDLTMLAPHIFSSIVIGLFAPVVHRGLLVLVPLLGFVCEIAVMFLVIFFNLHINWLFLGYALDGLLGSISGLMLVTYIYASEITSRGKNRTLLLALLYCGRSIIEAGVNVVTGQLIQYKGYTLPATLSAVCILLALLCSIVLVFMLPPRVSQPDRITDKSAITVFCDKLKEPFREKQGQGLYQLVGLAVLIFFVNSLQMFMGGKVRDLYVMNLPFCWSASHIGWFVAIKDFAAYGFIAAVTFLFTRYASGGVTVAFPTTIMTIASYMVYGLADTDLHIYVAAGLGIASSVVTTLLRGETSRALGPKAQGPWFAVIAVVEYFSFTLGSPVMMIYRESLSFCRGLVFFISSGLLIIELGILIFYQVTWRKYVGKEFSKAITNT